jgi:hypothetical protein
MNAGLVDNAGLQKSDESLALVGLAVAAGRQANGK